MMWIRIAAIALLTAAIAAPAAAQGIWSDEFASHQPNHDVHALLEHDDGSGASATMFIGGAFTRAGVTPAAGVAKWTGDGWAALGAGVEGVVFDMASMTIDGQPALIVAGEITAAGGEPTENLAIWMDEQWHTFSPASPLGPGVSGTIDAIEVFDDGGGDRLYVAGERLGTVGGQPIEAFAAWDGSAWIDAGIGLYAHGTTNIVALEVNGERSLFSAGSFAYDEFGVDWAGSVLRLDGAEWTVFCDSIVIPGSAGRPALAVFESTHEQSLYLATTESFGFPHDTCLARYRDGIWELIPDIESQSRGLPRRAVLVEAPGRGLLLGGLQQLWPQEHSMSYVGYDGEIYDSGLWEHAERMSDAIAYDLESGKPETIFAMHDVHDQHYTWPLVRFDGETDRALAAAGPDRHVRALRTAPGGSDLLIGGEFTSLGGTVATGLARLDDHGLHAVTGLGHVDPAVFTMVRGQVDGEPAIIVGGRFLSAGPHMTPAIAAWTASGWRPLGQGLRHEMIPLVAHVSKLVQASTAEGDWIVAAGVFTHSGEEPVSGVAAWDGEQWRDLGDAPFVNDLCWFDDGSGGALYATSGKHLYRYDGESWEITATVGGAPLPSQPAANALAVWPGASGPELIMSGSFEQVDSGGAPIAAHNIAAFNGDSWRNIGSLESAARLHVLDHGASPRLWATGQFQEVDGQPTDRVAVWDGDSWTPVGEPTPWRQGVAAAEAFHYRGKTRVFVGGNFTELAGTPAGFLTYQADAPCRADLDGDGQLTFFDFLTFNQLYAAGDPLADFDGDGDLTFFDFLTFNNEFAAGCP